MQSVGLHGVDDLDGPAVVDEECEEGKPIKEDLKYKGKICLITNSLLLADK